MAVTNYDTVNGRIRAEVTGGTRTGYLPDALGSVTAIVDESGAVQNTYRYKPYGELLAKTGAAADPKFMWVGLWGYRGKASSDHKYVRARHYASSNGQWLSIDPIWPFEMPYEYVSGAPITQLDPSGLSCYYNACCCCVDSIDAPWEPLIGQWMTVTNRNTGHSWDLESFVGAKIDFLFKFKPKIIEPVPWTGTMMDPCTLRWEEWWTAHAENASYERGYKDIPADSLQMLQWSSCNARFFCATGECLVIDTPGLMPWRASKEGGTDGWQNYIRRGAGKTFRFDICMRLTFGSSCPQGKCAKEKIVNIYSFRLTVTSPYELRPNVKVEFKKVSSCTPRQPEFEK